MKPGEKCQALKIYIDEETKYKGHNLYNAILFKMREIGMAGVTVTRAIAGYGKDKAIHTTRIIDLSELPIIVEVVDTEEQIQKAIPIVKEMVDKGLIMVTDVNVIKYGKD